MRLDRIDLKILEILQYEGRISKQTLAIRVGLSASPCLARMHKLEEAGLIRGYRADVDLGALCRMSKIFAVVTLKRHTHNDFSRFERELVKYPEVVECYAVGGGYDYIVKCVARDIDHYQTFIEQLLEADIGIGTYFTYIVTKTIKRDGHIPISYLVDDEELERRVPA